MCGVPVPVSVSVEIVVKAILAVHFLDGPMAVPASRVICPATSYVTP